VQETKAIVTDVAGTTRDTIEEYVNVRGVPLRLVDTAGIRETDDIVEKIGVERSRKAVQEADLILFMLTYNDVLTEEDEQLFELIQYLEYIVIVNQADLTENLDIEKVQSLAAGHPIIETAIIDERGIEQLEQAIADRFVGGDLEMNDMSYVSNVRHIQ